MKGFIILIGILTLVSCNKEKEESDLERFVAEHQDRTEDFLIACAAGDTVSFMGNSETPISIFYYNVDGATPAKLFVNRSKEDKDSFCNYEEVNLTSESLFNGRMGRFLAPKEYDNTYVIVAYGSANNYHISDPILIRATTHPTLDVSNRLVQTGDSLLPHFSWIANNIKGNVIYFSLIANAADDFVSGTYTTDRFWQFYDLSNVVLNVTPSQNPMLSAQEDYTYINMGVGEDNWVRTFGELPF